MGPPFDLIKYLFRVFCITIIYFVLGRLALLLAIPPGYSTAIWPPSAVALVAVFLYGNAVWPGVWLGSFLINFSISLTDHSIPGILNALPVAAGIAVGASVQAIFGFYLIRKYVHGKLDLLNLDEEKNIFLFMVLGGPVACLINATVSVWVLWASHLIGASEISFSWLNWWVGDSIGVIFLAPATLFLVSHKTQNTKDRLFILIPWFLTFSLAVCYFVYSSRYELSQLRAKFSAQGEEIADEIQNSLKVNEQSLRGVQAFFASGIQIGPKEFSSAMEFLMRKGPSSSKMPSVMGAFWSPVVYEKNRVEFERRASRELGRTFRILQATSSSPPIEKQGFALPIFYEWQLSEGSEIKSGLDLTSKASYQQAINRAFQTGELQVTPVIGSSDASKMLVLLPVHVPGVREGTRDSLGTPVGVIGGTSSFLGLSAKDFAELAGNDFQMTITDESGGTPVLLYSNQQKETLEGVTLINKGTQPISYSATFQMGGRTWRLYLRLTSTFLGANRSSQSWGGLVLGLILCSLTVSLLLMLTGRSEKVEVLIKKKTSDLKDAQDVILKREKSLIYAAKMKALGEMAGGMAHQINNPLAIITLNLEILLNSVKSQSVDMAVAARQIDAAIRAAQRATGVIKGLRSFSGTGVEDVLNIETVASVVKATLTYVQERFRLDGIDLSIGPISDEIEIKCQLVPLSQALLSLLNNAAEAIKNNNEKWIRLEVETNSSDVYISVTDSGKGIDEQVRDKIFEPFFTTKPLGTAVGLSLGVARGLIKGVHRGNLELDETCPNTKFIITLPRYNSALESEMTT